MDFHTSNWPGVIHLVPDYRMVISAGGYLTKFNTPFIYHFGRKGTLSHTYPYLCLMNNSLLAYGWRAGNLNLPIRIQPAGKILVSWCKHVCQERHWTLSAFLTGDGIKYPQKGIYNFRNQTSWQKVKNMNHFVFLSFYFGAKNGLLALAMASRS